MKKLISFFLVLSLLSVSGNLFAQDESSFKQNFSLSTQIETYGILWRPEKSQTASNSSYAEKETYPTMNLAYQIPGNHPFCERIHPFRNATSNNETNCKYGLQKEQRLE